MDTPEPTRRRRALLAAALAAVTLGLGVGVAPASAQEPVRLATTDVMDGATSPNRGGDGTWDFNFRPRGG